MLSQEFKELLGWARGAATTRVRANADTPEDARKAREFVAEGIGLVRTEHMFFAEDRIAIVREMIMAAEPQDRQKAVDRLLPFQREDFVGIFTAMEGLPVTIRLLDPPLHEFLPKYKDVLEEFTRLDARGINPTRHAELGAIRRGSRPCRNRTPCSATADAGSASRFPEIYEMQVRAIMEAACAVARRGIGVEPEIMIPLTGTVAEMKLTEEMTRRVAEAVQAETGVRVPYTVGTMIEVPRASLVADQLARHAEFFSFGTNDMTQMTFGYSRDDIGKFLPYYLEHKLLPADPFAVLDQEGVGEMIRIGIERGRRDPARPQGRHLRRARRRALVGGLLPSGRHDLRLVLALLGAHRLARGGPGRAAGAAPRRPPRGDAPCVSFEGVFIPVPTPYRGDAVATDAPPRQPRALEQHGPSPATSSWARPASSRCSPRPSATRCW